MSPKPKTSVKPTHYPYTILSYEYLKNKELKIPSSNDVLEFLRIEALLRSKSLMELYEATFGSKPTKNDEAIVIEQGIIFGWGILKGEHHSLLLKAHPEFEDQITGQPYGRFGINDLQLSLLEQAPSGQGEVMNWIQDGMIDPNSPYLWLQIDSRSSPSPMCEKLKKMVRAKLNTYNLKQAALPKSSSTKTINLDPYTWIDYFRCYDLLHCDGKSYKEIAFEVYKDAPIQRKTDHVQKAVKRVSTLIQKAESNNWPPPSGFLK